MKAAKWQRTVSLLLCLLMAMSFFIVTAPKAYAAEPEWPHLTSVGTPTNDEATKPYFVPVGLREDFTFTVKDIKIEHVESLTACALGTIGSGYTAYDAGTITFYVDNLPTESDKLEGYSGTDYGFNFQTSNDLVTVVGTGDGDTVKFFNLVNLSVAKNFEYHNKLYYYIQTADKVRYHYNVQVLQYEDNGEAEPEWPHLTSVGTPTNDEATKPYFVPVGLREDFAFTVKDIKIKHVESLTACALGTIGSGYTAYDAGTITFYVDNLPTESDKLEGYSGTDYGFNFQTSNDLVTVVGTGDGDTVKFFNLVNLSVAKNFEYHNKLYYYIQTADKVRYHYNVQVLQYTGEAGEELTLSAGSATRTSKEEASVKFSASAAGNYYYALYDEQQTAPAVDTTSANTNTGTMATTNTITVSGMTDCRTKYLYIVGVDAAGKASAPLEIVIPGIPFELKHDKQGLRGFTTLDGSGNITNGWLYTEKFTDAFGKTITKAVPGEKVTVNFGVFAIDEVTPLGSVHYDKDADVITDSIGIRQHVLKKWNISGLGEFTTTERSFTFTMPGNDVTIQAETELSGVPIQLKSSDANVQATLRCDAQLGSGSGSACYYSDKRDCLVAGASVTLRAYSIADGYVLDKWEITSNGTPVDERKITRNEDGSAELTLEAGGDYVFTAVLREKKFAKVTAEVNDSIMGRATVTVGENTGASQYPVYEGQSVILTAAPGSRYMLECWEVKDADNKDVTYFVAADVNVATFIMPDTGKSITAKAFFKVDPEQASTENALTAVELDVPGTAVSRAGSTFTITLPAGTNTSKLGEKILKLTISDFATVTKEGDPDKDWTEGAACGMELDKAATFTVTAEKGNTQAYTIIITKAKSSEKDITAAVLLNQTGDTTPFARAEISETEITFTLPSDTDKAVLNSIDMKYLKLTYPESATVKMKDGYDDATNGGYRWSNGDVMCNMSINSPVKFTVTAEDGSTKEYTIGIKYTAPNAPTLSNGSATRTSKTAATVKFTSSEAGNYFYKVVTHGAAAPTVDEIKKSTTKGTASAGETTFTLSNLTEGARDIYIVVVGAAGGESTALKVEIPAYGSGTDTPDTGAYKISISAPKGGTITTNRTKADAGDEIIVTVTPDNGYQMVSGSLTYTLAIAGGETKTITNGRFTMPAGDVSITCKWETATTTVKGITSFSINGVAGAVNNSTNTITITMPRGTDVTKLTPVIATNGVKSLTPGSGETVDFTNAVTYTAAMEDGSSKTYTVTVYVDKGTLADQFWDKLTDFATQVPWWEYAKHQQSTSKYPKYW